MDETKAHETRISPREIPEAERLATLYCARRAAGETVETGEFLEQLATEEEREEFRELARQAELAMKLAPPQPERERILSNRYRLEREIGAGGMGRVFAAFDQHLERRVAIKVLSVIDVGDPEREELLLKESRILAALQHPGIVSVHETGRDGELFYVVMDLIDGASLSTVIERIASRLQRDGDADRRGPIRGAEVLHKAIDRPVPEGRANLVDESSYGRTVARIVLEITRTLEAAHSENVVHRDLKPSNVMLIGGGNPIVLDFGLAGSSDRVAGAITEGLFGTVSYLAPEQARLHKVGTDKRTDVYQLGLLLYEFLTLERAFGTGAIADVLERVKRGDFQLPRKLNPGVAKDLEAICLKAMEVAPGSRYQSVREFSEDLEVFLSQDGIPKAAKTNLARGLARRARVATQRHPAVFSLAAIVLLSLSAWMYSIANPRQKSIDFPYVMAVADSGSPRRIDPQGSYVRPGERIAVRAAVHGQEYHLYALATHTFDGEIYVEPILPIAVKGGKHLASRRSGEYGLRVPEETESLVFQEVDADFESEGLRLYADDSANPALEFWLASIDERISADGGSPLLLADAERMRDDILEGSGTRGVAVPDLDPALLERLSREFEQLLDRDEFWSEASGRRFKNGSWPVVVAE